MADVETRFTSVNGPFKHEIIQLSDVTDADTVTTNMQRPSFGIFTPTTGGNAIVVAIGVTFVGRVATLDSVDLANEEGVLQVWGF